MLSSLEIANFKGIKTGKISDLAQVNIIVGKNNSGKSTVLDALLLMRCAFAKFDLAGKDGFEQLTQRKVSRGAKLGRELYHRFAVNAPIDLRATFASGSSVTQLWTRMEYSDPRVNFVESNHGVTLASQESVDTFHRANSLWAALKSVVGDEYAELLPASALLDSTSINSPYLDTFWERLTETRIDKQLTVMANEIYDLGLDGIDQGPFGGTNRLVAKLEEHSVAVDWLGDGLRYALNILALGLLLKETILMVEELETHQHPDSLKKLTETLFTLAKQQNLQLFLTTHSWELMTYALEAAEEKDIGLTFHHLDLDQDGELHARAIYRPDAKLLMDIGHDPRRISEYTGIK